MSESVDRRVLGAIRCVDAITGNSIGNALSVTSSQLLLRANRKSIYVIFNAPKLDPQTAQFDPMLPWPAAAPFEVSIQDPSRRYLPRRAMVQAPQTLPPAIDPSQPFDPAKVLGDPAIVFNPQPVPLFPSPAAPVSPNWAVIYISVIRSGSTPSKGLPWCIVRVARSDNQAVLATTVGDARGEAVLAIPGLGPEVSGSDTGAVTQATVAVAVTAWFDPSVTSRPSNWIPNPDDMLNNLATGLFKTGNLTSSVGPGQTVSRSLAISV